MSAARIRLDVVDSIATVTLDAPGRGNSLDAAMLEGLEATLVGLDPQVRVVLLEGAGTRSFSTGYHVPSLLAELSAGQSVSDFANHPLERALRALEAVAVPTLAVVQGNAYGAGCELALACDIRLAAEEARFCMPPARLGVLYSATGIRRLLELIGPARTRELLFTAQPVAGPRALAMGLVNHLTPRAELPALARSMAATIAGNAPLSIRHTKAILSGFLSPPELSQEALAIVAQMREECFRSPDFLARTQRLAGKSDPKSDT